MLLNKESRRNCFKPKKNNHLKQFQRKEFENKARSLIKKRESKLSIVSNHNISKIVKESNFFQKKRKIEKFSTVVFREKAMSSYARVGRSKKRSYNVSIECMDKAEGSNTFDSNTKKKRKNGFLQTNGDIDNANLMYKMNKANLKLLKTRECLDKTEKRIRARSMFNPNLKKKYIDTIRNVEMHKIQLLQKKYGNFKKILEKRQFLLDEKKKREMKKFNNFSDITRFQKKLLRYKKVLGTVQSISFHPMKPISYLIE